MIYRDTALCRTTHRCYTSTAARLSEWWTLGTGHHRTRLLRYPVDRKQYPHPHPDEQITRCQSSSDTAMYRIWMIDTRIYRRHHRGPSRCHHHHRHRQTAHSRRDPWAGPAGCDAGQRPRIIRAATPRRRPFSSYFRCCARYLFISNIVHLSRPNTFFRFASARISRLSAGFCKLCFRI